MNKKILSLAACIAIAYPSATSALGLGEIQSNSTLNQPFSGVIELHSIASNQVGQLRARIADPSVFKRVGIDRPGYLNHFSFRASMQNGKPVLIARSSAPIQDPFVNFLVEVSWPGGQLLKEYTVLLDPPTLAKPNTAVNYNNVGVRPRVNHSQTAAQQARIRQQRHQEWQQKQRQQQMAAQRQRGQQHYQPRTYNAPSKPVARSHQSAPNSYRVRRGDYMYSVAKRMRYSGVSTDQMMLAIFQQNSHAFAKGNVNNLRSGVRLTRPTIAQVKQNSRGSARSEIAEMNRAWRNRSATTAVAKKSNSKASKSARLEVSGTSSKKGSSSSIDSQLTSMKEALSAKKRESRELQSRVSELESILRKKNRIMTLKSKQLASLQQQLGMPSTALSTGTAVPDISADGANAVIRTPGTAGTDNFFADDKKANNKAPNKKAVDKAKKPKKRIKKPINIVDTEEKDGDIISMITQPEYIGGGVAAVGLLGLFGWYFNRRRKQPADDAFAFDDDFGGDDFGGDDFDDPSNLGGGGASAGFDSDSGFDNVDAHSSGFDNSGFGADSSSPKAEHSGANDFDDLLAGSNQTDAAATNGGEGDDPLSNADVYINFGLYDQAESELTEAIAQAPSNASLHAKLLEAHYAAKDTDKFSKAISAAKSSGVVFNEHQSKVDEWASSLGVVNGTSEVAAQSQSDDDGLDMGTMAMAGAGALAAGVATNAFASNEASDGDSFLNEAAEAVDAPFEADSSLDTLDDFNIDNEFDVSNDLDSALEVDGVSETSLPTADLGGIQDLTNQSSVTDLNDQLGTSEAAVAMDDQLDDFSELDALLGEADDSLDNANNEVDAGFDMANVDSMTSEVTEGESTDKDIDNLMDFDMDELDFGDMDIGEGGAAVKATDQKTSVKSESADALSTDSLDDDLNLDALLDEKVKTAEEAVDTDFDDLAGADFDSTLSSLAGQSMDDLSADDSNLDLNVHLNELLPESSSYVSSTASAAETDDDFDFMSSATEHTQAMSDKLSLAKAYIDMDDVDGARATLEEVKADGDTEQQKEAESLLQKL